MGTGRQIEEDIGDLIQEYAEEHCVSEELLEKIYWIERDYISMDRREGLPSNLRKALEEHLEDYED